MSKFEYKVVPAPRRGEKARGVKGVEARFAHALSRVMNELAAEGWEYQRADTLPCDRRSGLTGTTTSFENMLVFRRELAEDVAAVDESAEDEQETPTPVFSHGEGEGPDLPPPAAPKVKEIAAAHAPALAGIAAADAEEAETPSHAPAVGPAEPRDTAKTSSDIAAQ